MADESEQERVLESRVVKEEVVRKRGTGIRRKLGMTVLALAFAAGGYGIKTVEVNKDYLGGSLQKLSKQYMLEVSRKAIDSGYSTELWDHFPEIERREITKEYLTDMPLSDSWGIVLPVVKEKVRKGWVDFKSEVKSMRQEVGIKVYMKDKDDRQKEEDAGTLEILKEFFGGENGNR